MLVSSKTPAVIKILATPPPAPGYGTLAHPLIDERALFAPRPLPLFTRLQPLNLGVQCAANDLRFCDTRLPSVAFQHSVLSGFDVYLFAYHSRHGRASTMVIHHIIHHPSLIRAARTLTSGTRIPRPGLSGTLTVTPCISMPSTIMSARNWGPLSSAGSSRSRVE